MVSDFVRYYTRTTISHDCIFCEVLHENHNISWLQISWDITPEPEYLMVAAKRNATCIGSKLGQLYVVPLVLVQIQSKSGHSWQGLLCLNAKSWLRCSHISQPGLTQLYSVHHEFTKIWCFNINISQSSDLWDIYLVNPSSILALKPHSNCLRLVLHASIKVNDDGLPRVVLAQLFLNLILILNLIPK